MGTSTAMSMECEGLERIMRDLDDFSTDVVCHSLLAYTPQVQHSRYSRRKRAIADASEPSLIDSPKTSSITANDKLAQKRDEEARIRSKLQDELRIDNLVLKLHMAGIDVSDQLKPAMQQIVCSVLHSL